MPNNSSYIDANHEYLLEKSNPNKENFDVLAFASRRIIDVKIPDTVEIIGSYSFQYNTRIECFIIPPNVKRINNFAFNSCKSLKKFIIPSNSKLQYLGKNALDCISITSLVIPNCVRFLYEDYFILMSHLKIIQIEDDSQLYSINYRMLRMFINVIMMFQADMNDKVVIKNKSNTDNDFLEIDIKNDSGYLKTYSIKKDETVSSLKKKIKCRIGASPDQMELKISDHHFKDEEIVSNYVISNNKQPIELITKDYKNIIINFITDDGRKFSLNITPKCIIQQVVEKVAQYLQVRIDLKQLFYGCELLNGTYSSITLYQYWIHDGSTINVKIKKIQPGSYQIFIKLFSGIKLALDVLPTETFEDLIIKIEIETNMQFENMRLVFNGKFVYPNDADSTLEEEGVVADSCLIMLRSCIH